MGEGSLFPILIIGGVIAVLYFNPGLLNSFTNNNNQIMANETVIETAIPEEAVVPIKDYFGKPVKDTTEFSCRYDSDCIIYNDNCSTQCRCDTSNGECYTLK